MKLPMPTYGNDDAVRSIQLPVLALLGGHGLPAEFPEEFTARLLKFVAGLS
ncbi:hypothetical protein [Kribbella pittospori]|uniref:hypothetical protein n=1 Tax=Kribbella pittospori TaxID=722689 RepID=UPI0013F406E5|nr:hypothetical protein [Kribbella pittospori]